MSSRHACLGRPRRLPRPAYPREKPGFWVWDGEISRDADCPLERVGFEPLVPLVNGLLFLAGKRKAGLGKDDDLKSVVCCGDRELASRSLRQTLARSRGATKTQGQRMLRGGRQSRGIERAKITYEIALKFSNVMAYRDSKPSFRCAAGSAELELAVIT